MSWYQWTAFSVVWLCVLCPATCLAGDILVDINNPSCVNSPSQPDPYSVVYCSVDHAVMDSSPGDTVIVSPGIYTMVAPVQVTTAGLSIVGPQENIDPRPSWSSFRQAGSQTEAILDGSGVTGSIFLIDADDVILNGLEIRNGTGDLIKQEYAYSGTTVSYCIVHQSSGDEAIQLKNCNNCAITMNYTYFTAGDGISYAGSSNSSIIGNEIGNIYSEHGGIYVYGSQNISIDGNLIATIVHDSRGHGIRFGSSGNGCQGGSLVNNRIIGSSGSGICIEDSEGFQAAAIAIIGNEIHEVDQAGAGWAGIRIEENSSEIVMEENRIFQNPVGIHISSYEGLPDSSSITVFHNDIFSNDIGFLNEGAGITIAEDNWWGDSSGPLDSLGDLEVPPCQADPALEINIDGSGNPCGENVDYCPWLEAPFNNWTPTPTQTPPPTVTPTVTDTPVPSQTPLPTYTPPPTYSPQPTFTPPPTFTPLPTHTPNPTATPAPTYTPLPTFTAIPTNTPSSTPTPSPAPTHTPTPSIPCDTTGMALELPADHFSEGDICYLTAWVCNRSPEILHDHPLFVVLDIEGELWYAPSWGYFQDRFDYYDLDYAVGLNEVVIVHEFTWPSGISPYSGAWFHGALVTPDFNHIVGTIASVEFGWE